MTEMESGNVHDLFLISTYPIQWTVYTLDSLKTCKTATQTKCESGQGSESFTLSKSYRNSCHLVPVRHKIACEE